MSWAASGTLSANSTVSITAAAAVTDGVDFTASGHGMSVGDPCEITGTTDYNGFWIVTGVPDANSFIVRQQGLAFTSSQSGTVRPGDSMGGAATVTNITSGVSVQSGSRYYTQREVFEASAGVTITVANNCILYIDPEVYEICFNDGYTNTDHSILVQSGGTLIVGRPIVHEGVTRYSKGTAIVCVDDGRVRSNDAHSNISVESGGRFDWYGGIISITSGTLEIASGSDVNIYSQDAVYLRPNTDQELSTDDICMGQIRQRAADLTIQGLTNIGGYSTSSNNANQLAYITTPTDPIRGYLPIHCGRALSTSGATTGSPLIEGYAPQGNTQDYAGFGSSITNFELRNNAAGTDHSFVAGNTGADHQLEVTHDYTLNVFDSAGVEITAELLWFYRDVDNGNRANVHTNNLSDQTYNGGSGDLVNFTLLYVDVNDADNAPPPAANFDYRLDDGDTTDEASIAIWSYLHLPTTVTALMKGTGGTIQNTTVFTDTNITQTTRATVDAYTTIANGGELYDRSKSEKISLTANIIEFPNRNTPLITGAGSNLDLGAISLTIDGAAVSAWALNQTGSGRITIDAGTVFATTGKFDTLITTGDVTVADTTSIDGWTINGDLLLNAAQDLSNVTVNGDLRIATGANSTLDFTNVTVTGNVFNDSASNTLTINNFGGSMTAGDPGTGIGQTNIANLVTITLTDLIVGSEVRLYSGTLANATAATELDGVESCVATTQDLTFDATGPGYIVVFLEGYVLDPIVFASLPVANTSIPVAQQVDRTYENP